MVDEMRDRYLSSNVVYCVCQLCEDKRKKKERTLTYVRGWLHDCSNRRLDRIRRAMDFECNFELNFLRDYPTRAGSKRSKFNHFLVSVSMH